MPFLWLPLYPLFWYRNPENRGRNQTAVSRGKYSAYGCGYHHRENGHARILELFGKGKADILIGTQMIAKGHDFPNVTLVGILAADLSLNLGTYQAAETCFQLITQAAGRAGRGELAGRVFIQTYQPENHAIRMAAAQDYEGFYQEEILLRQAMEYPPFLTFSLCSSLEKWSRK